MGLVKVIRIFKNKNYYLYIRKTLPRSYAKNEQQSAMCIVQRCVMTDKTQKVGVEKVGVDFEILKLELSTLI